MSDYNNFMSRYSIRNVHLQRDRDYRHINYNYNHTASYYADREEIIEMELPRSGFEQLVNVDREYDRIWEEQRDEAWLRSKHPALKDAYNKYQMLLAIYK